MKAEFPFNIADLHTTPLGAERIRRNLNLSDATDVVEYCSSLIIGNSTKTERQGKNWYVTSGKVRITINAHSNTIITAHKV